MENENVVALHPAEDKAPVSTGKETEVKTNGKTEAAKPAKPKVKVKPKVKEAKPAKAPKKMKAKANGKAGEPKLYEVADRSSKSRALKSLGLTVDSARVPGVCLVKGCKDKTTTARSQWCREHKKAIRKEQLRLNNITWHKRIEDGKAGHHVAYRGKATQWALQHKDKALQQVKKGASILDAKAFAEALRRSQAEAKAREARKTG